MEKLEFPLISFTYQSKIPCLNFQIRVCSRSKFYRETSLARNIFVGKPKKNENTGNGKKR